MTLNASTNLPGGMTHADYNRLAGSKVEFIRVNELPTSYIKEYPTIYILMKDDSIGIMYEYNSSTNTWLKYGGDLGIIPITGEEYDNLSEADKNKDVFYLITDRIAYLEDVSVMKGATAEADGKIGTVPAPKVGDQNKFLRGDGTWSRNEAEVPLDSPSFTGTPKAPTAPVETNNTQIANTEFVHAVTKKEIVDAEINDSLYNITVSGDGNTYTQTYVDGRVTTLTKTSTGFREIRKDSNGVVISDITTTVNSNGNITSNMTT